MNSDGQKSPDNVNFDSNNSNNSNNKVAFNEIKNKDKDEQWWSDINEQFSTTFVPKFAAVMFFFTFAELSLQAVSNPSSFFLESDKTLKMNNSGLKKDF